MLLETFLEGRYGILFCHVWLSWLRYVFTFKMSAYSFTDLPKYFCIDQIMTVQDRDLANEYSLSLKHGKQFQCSGDRKGD